MLRKCCGHPTFLNFASYMVTGNLLTSGPRVLGFISALMLSFLLGYSNNAVGNDMSGSTNILNWEDGKRAAISITFDDGSQNQFDVALPILDQLGLHATFFINTSSIVGAKNDGKYIGRSVTEIVEKSGLIPTNAQNIFERASAIRYVNHREHWESHLKSGQLFEKGKRKEAYDTLDIAYARVRAGEIKTHMTEDSWSSSHKFLNWKNMKSVVNRGHEFASHGVTHSRFAVLDEANMMYELEASQEELRINLSDKHSFSAAIPYGTDDERVMSYAYKVYPAIRNRMPEPFLTEINRWNNLDPLESDQEYVQWQRGILSSHSIDDIKNWIDTSRKGNNIWLVLVIHGIEGVGWQPLREDTLRNFLEYIKSGNDQLWVPTFRDATKYMRERMNAEVISKFDGNKILVSLTHNLDPELYDYPLTLKTYLPPEWKSVGITQKTTQVSFSRGIDEHGMFAQYKVKPNSGPIIIHR